MASKLNPGADATLVGVAYRAAMANTPADYSDTLERAADSYTKTMEASSEMWGNIAKVGAAIGSEMVKNAQELTDMVAKGATLNPEDAKMFYDEIYGLKDDFKELGTFGGMFGDRETRLKRAELKAKQQELFADIDNAVANLKVGADAIAAGTFDYELAGLENEETINAIIKSNLKNKFTNEGNMAKLSRNEKGELMYTLYKENGELADNPNGTKEPVTMTLKEFNESIATNVKDGGAMMKSFVDLREAEAKAGNGALNSTYDPERKQMTLNNLDLLLGDKPVNLKRAMRTPIGYSNTSFFDDITREQGEHSVGLYNTLLEVTGGNVLTGEITEGMVDIDGVEGISRQEAMNADNYKILTANIIGLKDPEASKAYFKEYAVKEMEAAYKYGYSKKPPVPGSGAGGEGDQVNVFKPGSGEYVVVEGKQRYIPSDVQNRRRSNVIDIVTNNKDGAVFSGELGNYTWVKETGQWQSGETEDGKPQMFTTFQVMTDERVYNSASTFEQGLTSSSGDNAGLDSLTEDDTLTISNMFSQNLNENRVQTAINNILKKYKVPQRATVPFTPFNINRVNIGNEEFDTSKPSDQKRMLEIIKQLIGNVPQQNTSAGKTDEIDRMINQYSSPKN